MRRHETRALALRHAAGLRPRRRRGAGVAADEEVAPDPPEPPPLGADHRVSAGREDQVVDLLNPRPSIVIDADGLRRALSFAFAGGDTGRTITRALWTAPVAPTDWDPRCFTRGLFLDDLIELAMQVHLDGGPVALDRVFLTRLLTHPPRDLETVEYRREILRELSGSADLRARFFELYRALRSLREELEGEGALDDLDDGRRRLRTLRSIRRAIERMSEGFDRCESGLRRVHRFGARAASTEGYARLRELLDYDSHLAGVELQLRLGADGRIRRFELTKVSENTGNRFYQSPLGRWWTRLKLIFRGYVLSQDGLVNRWVDSVFDGVVELLPPLVQLLGEMEFYLAALAFADAAASRGLEVCFADLDGGERRACQLEGLFNPLLFSLDSPPVACDLEADAWEAITIVTGPNSGGKTRLLQALAIAQMLSACGMFAPARSAKLGWATGLFVSLIEDARADQEEGRLGTELMRIRELFERARPGYLIVLDELCSGTNPSEGEEIFRLVLSLLHELGARVFITTHFLQFAGRLRDEAPADSQLRFLRVHLDEASHPTFRFVPGVAETSLAHLTAARLGVTRDELLALVRRHRQE